MDSGEETYKYRYDASLANHIELKWQSKWEEDGTYHAPNPSGPLSDSTGRIDLPKLFIMDMFPYPSGTGLHVGHPLGFIGTDVYARYKRMTGHNVLHTMGYARFGLPAEEHARQTGQHPRENTNANIKTCVSNSNVWDWVTTRGVLYLQQILIITSGHNGYSCNYLTHGMTLTSNELAQLRS